MKPLTTPLLASVDRAIAEIRQGNAVQIKHDPLPAIAIWSAELLSPLAFASFHSHPIRLALTAKRAQILGLSLPELVSQTVLIPIKQERAQEVITWMIDPQTPKPDGLEVTDLVVESVLPGSATDAAITLLKLARLLPAALVIEPPPLRKLPSVSASSILHFQTEQARTLVKVAEAQVPLSGAENTKIIAFRPSNGGTEHLAIVIGEPDITQPVLIRLHSECFTGDLLGSLRCDCGDQLRGAISEIAAHGSGILLYLAQEGRGIGLVNKLRAYTLQDQGFDTIDANIQLGFDDDERIYLPAAQMLKALNINSVRLLTNNPAKIEALAKNGIPVVERVPHIFPSNSHNTAYLATKAAKSGHLF